MVSAYSPQQVLSKTEAQALRRRLLAWYDRHGRVLPWRYRADQKPDPYHVWLSEIMLQQTTVATVIPYFKKFTHTWPSFMALAQADDAAVMQAWAGLGYYARARNLLACARAVAASPSGTLPDNQAELLKLPGIGPYTAAAICAIAFHQPAQPVDGNIERVISRLRAIATPLPALKDEIRTQLVDLITSHRASDMVQGLMDLGATICTPKAPKCALCPWQEACQGYAQGRVDRLPVKRQKAEKANRHGTVFWLIDPQGRILVYQRPKSGLLGGMIAFPSQDWDAPSHWQPPPRATLALEPLTKSVGHVFTHFNLRLTIQWARISARDQKKITLSLSDAQWVDRASLTGLALPTLMQKVYAVVSSELYDKGLV